MNERYVQLYALEGDLYAAGVPVIIKSGVLFGDNATGNVLAQIVFENSAQKTITGLKVKITSFDMIGRQLGGDVEYLYQGIAAAPQSQFGSQNMIQLPDNLARSFSITITDVMFRNEGSSGRNARSIPVMPPVTPPENTPVKTDAGKVWDAPPAMPWTESAKEPRKGKKKIITVAAIVAAVAVVACAGIVLSRTKNSGDGKPTSAIEGSSVIAAGFSHTAGLKKDGTVAVVGSNYYNQCDVEDWKDIVAIAAGDWSTLGIKSDGTVVATGQNDSGQCDVDDWEDIVAISAGFNHTVGLKSDGTVVATGNNGSGLCDVEDWDDIVAISAGFNHTVGLKSDGTAVAVGISFDGRSDVKDWTDIIAISAGNDHTAGLKSDGTVVAVGDNDEGECDLDDWEDIVAISAGDDYTIGLKSDGTVVAAGKNNLDCCDVGDWKDIVAICIGNRRTVGLKSDGTIVETGTGVIGEDGKSEFADIKLPK